MTPDPIFIKVCGITRVEDAVHAVQQGATAVGFVFWPRSPRAITAARAADIIAVLPATVARVGVFVNEPIDRIRAVVEQAGLTDVQLHGDEPSSYGDELEWPLLRATSVETIDDTCRAWPAETRLLLDTMDRVKRGGTGEMVDWTRAAGAALTRRIVLAGGLTPENVAEAIRAVHPFGVDVSSGVESAPGIKDVDKVTRFVANARRAFESMEADLHVRPGDTRGR
jgi:phosphoribosylanthranilate isomerase